MYSPCVSTTPLEELCGVCDDGTKMHIYKGLERALEGMVQRMRSIYWTNEQGLPLFFITCVTRHREHL